MSANVLELVRELEVLGNKINEAANDEKNFHLIISGYLQKASYSCWRQAEEIKHASYYLGDF